MPHRVMVKSQNFTATVFTGLSEEVAKKCASLRSARRFLSNST